MKFLSSQLSHFLTEPQARRNVRALLKFIAFLLALIALYAVLFHVIMLRVEGRQHSWLTGVYWTLTVMTTLGFGDITFESDLGRAFSIVVLVSGVVLLLIVLPFLFIRYFYSPWLEARIRWRAPRAVPADVRGHVVICAWDAIAPGLADTLALHEIPYFVLEPDPVHALRMHGEGVSVVTGDVDARATYEALRVRDARLVLANDADTVNTNITLTVREIAPDVPVFAVVEHHDSIDILTLSGATCVLPLKERLGEQLALRVNAGSARAHVVGAYRDLAIADFPVHETPLVGATIRDCRLRERTGVSVVAVWQRGHLLPAHAATVLTGQSVPVVVGTAEQLRALDAILASGDANTNPVVVIGGGKVGRSAIRALRRNGIPVHLIERDPALGPKLADLPDRLFVGDAADRDLLMRAGLAEAPSVVLTANDDATNIYLAVFCRRLRPDVRVISRITHARNIEAIHRAGADLVLSYASLGAGMVFSMLQGRAAVVLGAGLDLFHVPVPRALVDKTLAESRIGELTGMNVIAVEHGGEIVTNPPATLRLPAGADLLMVGSAEQLQRFTNDVLPRTKRRMPSRGRVQGGL